MRVRRSQDGDASMASLGHVMVGMAAARLARRGQRTIFASFSAMVVWSGLSLLPDADAFGFALGVEYASRWGHRGFMHSIAFAIVVAALVGIAAKAMRLPALRTACIAAVVLVSHPLLDCLTDGGLGCALLWPFSDHRFFAPWTPLPVAPIGRGYWSMEGLRVATTELVVFAPFALYALWPAKRPPKRPLAADPATRV
jgi:inner membrane protein